MARPVTLFTGQWADLPLETVAEKASSWGFDGLELACWGDHFEVDKALADDAYIVNRKNLLKKYGLKCYAVSNHLVGQCVCDPIDSRHKSILPERLWQDGDPEGVRQRCAEEMIDTGKAAKKLGVEVVNGFTGSSIWSRLYFFPPCSREDVEKGFQDFAKRWLPILNSYRNIGVKFALEVHPTEIAYDIITAVRALKAVEYHSAFGFNFDPSHLVHQFVDPVMFINEFAEKIFHVHVKDSRLQLTGRNSILASHLEFGHPDRGWNFVSPGRGDVEWDPVIRALNRACYQGPLSIEWEDSGMHREFGAKEALSMIRQEDFTASDVVFDAAFSNKK